MFHYYRGPAPPAGAGSREKDSSSAASLFFKGNPAFLLIKRMYILFEMNTEIEFPYDLLSGVVYRNLLPYP